MRPFAALVMLSAMILPAAAQPPEAGQKGSADCMVKIEFAPNVLPLEWDLVNSLVNTSPIKDQAARDAGQASLEYAVTFGPAEAAAGVGTTQPPDVRPGPPAIRPSVGTGVGVRPGALSRMVPAPARRGVGPGYYAVGRTGGSFAQPGRLAPASGRYAGGVLAEGVLLGRLAVHVPGGSDELAEQLMAAVCRRLEQALDQTSKTWLKRAKGRMAVLEEEARRAEKHLTLLQEARQALFDKAGRSDLLRESVLGDIKNLESGKDRLEMTVAEAQAEGNALMARIAMIGKKVEAGMKDDPIAAELEKIVTGREAELQRVKTLAGRGAASDAEVRAAHAQVAQARVEVLRRREEVNRAAGAEQLGRLNADATSASVRLVSSQKGLELITARLKQIKEKSLLALADEFERLEPKVQLASRDYMELTQLKGDLEGEVRTLRPPAVTIIGATTEKAAPGGDR
jgi:hypothetical protein